MDNESQEPLKMLDLALDDEDRATITKIYADIKAAEARVEEAREAVTVAMRQVEHQKRRLGEALYNCITYNRE